MTTPAHTPLQRPRYNLGLCTVLIPSDQIHAEVIENTTEITFGTKALVIACSLVERAAPQESEFDWPAWDPSSAPDPDQHWKAVFRAGDHTFVGFYHEAASAEESELIHAPPTTLPPALYETVQAQRFAILCTGLIGDPDADQVTAAQQQGRLRGVLVEALFISPPAGQAPPESSTPP
ncbi:hypothetical protein [Streptomyces sp. C3-3]|uniref:hypothetical protein n=1 Tax=Streptomyces sp. C3-3 TaxID=2824901 RepID=UPI001B35D340|nr:hypothetical protein [Streptomyces sp. C3-3]MBQ1117334.1 hypothetical protein [Streptomyces sp. C3-3]